MNFIDEIKILGGEAERRRVLDDRLKKDIKKDMNRIFFSWTNFAKHCGDLLDNIKEMQSSLSKESSILDKQRKIIGDMENIAKITGEVVQSQLSFLLKKRNSLQMVNNEIHSDFFSRYYTYWDMALLGGGTKSFIRSAFSVGASETEKCGFKIKGNLYKLIELNNEIASLLSENYEIQRLFGENKVFKKLL
mgnify:CR=1 FL=1